MKTTYNWIREYVPGFEGSLDEMCDLFTMSGTEVEYYTDLDGDYVIEFAVTSNRVDCLGMVGLGRELAAAAGMPFVHPDWEITTSNTDVDDAAAVSVEDTDGCPRYTAHVIEGITVGESPDWMKARLEAIGLRPVNNVVDVTNYVLFEMNQPFHAFDLAKLPEPAIHVRRGRAKESITAINDKTYELDGDMCAITSGDRVVAIAGVMGGLDTEVSSTTKDILLETAFFEPVRNRKTSRRLNLASDSSFRFERGIDPQRVLVAARRCARLITEMCGGTIRSGVIDVDAGTPAKSPIEFRFEQVERITGIEVPWERCREILESLEIVVNGDPSSGISVTPPSWRNDLEREIDMVEEIIRIHGLHHLPLQSGMGVRTVTESIEDRVDVVIKDRLGAIGYFETLTASFVSEVEGEGCFFAETRPVTIRNAMRRDENALRQSLLPSLLRIRKNNQDLGNPVVRLFECTVIYLAHDPAEIPEHLPIVGGLIDGDYRDARGAVETVAAALGAEGVIFDAIDEAGCRLLEKEGGATILVGGSIVGYIGRPRADWLKRYDLKMTPYFFELRRDRLVESSNLVPTFAAPSRYPGIARDLAVVVTDQTSWGEIRAVVDACELPHLDDVQVFDEYRGKQIEKGKKSLAFNLSYRSHERTLTNEEVDASQGKLIDALREKLSAEVRV